MKGAKGKESKQEDFVPLRKSLKRKSTGREDNFMWSYYDENEKVSRLSDEVVDEIRWKNGIHIEGEDCPKPIESFHDLNLPPELSTYLAKKNFQVPTPIQMQSLSCVMSGRDIIGLAETGSGKTLAYSLPLCMLLRTKAPSNPGDTPVALILTPTRELMQQVFMNVSEMLDVIRCPGNPGTFPGQGSVNPFPPKIYTHTLPPPSHNNFGQQGPFHFHSIPGPSNQSVIYDTQQFTARYKAVAVCGGVPVSTQTIALREGADVVVATPGRLLDLCKRGALCLDKITYLVMDEADRMLGMGMEEQLRKIVGLATGTSRARQTLLWSATLPESLERLARSAVLNPITIQVGPGGLIAPSVQQNVVFLYHYQKPQKLLETLRTTPYPPVIVFTSSIQNVDYVTELLKQEQFHASGLHSEKPQDYRFKLVKAFRDGKVDILVATDVASRGLDFPEVTHVINYDLPDTIECYIHRCGRTGRIGHHGIATSFLTLDCKIAEELKEMLEVMEQPIPKELKMPKQFGKKIIRTEMGDRVIN
ncbi:DEAD-box ATP-dependent RNA helicase 35A [Nematostella vectensis]|uniref:DEAD-box ATP-dependent RNA helicase 35A n=1 Tax=Nematostella vectensis TaxID=45351 RepID=UPI00139058FC|nr:DEAD-box ATP-dependent RNA helicase 35A [Nematostella vectensis]